MGIAFTLVPVGLVVLFFLVAFVPLVMCCDCPFALWYSSTDAVYCRQCNYVVYADTLQEHPQLLGIA